MLLQKQSKKSSHTMKKRGGKIEFLQNCKKKLQSYIVKSLHIMKKRGKQLGFYTVAINFAVMLCGIFEVKRRNDMVFDCIELLRRNTSYRYLLMMFYLVSKLYIFILFSQIHLVGLMIAIWVWHCLDYFLKIFIKRPENGKS